MLADPEHQEINIQSEVTWKTLRAITQSLMVHVRVSEAYIHFAVMYMAYHIFPVLPIKDVRNEDGEPTIPFKLATCAKSSISHLRVLFFPCVVRKANAHVGTKASNMCYQEQKGFRVIFVGIPQHQKGYLVYVPCKRKIVSFYAVIFDESFSNALVYTSQLYLSSMNIQLAVSYIPYAEYSTEQNGDIITFVQFEEGD